MFNQTVINVINANEGKKAFAIRDISSDKPNELIYLYRNGKFKKPAYDSYINMNVLSWHCEDNYEDNGTLNFTEPHRIVMTVDSKA